MLLVGLFLVIKYLGKEWINWLMSIYFALAGLYSVPYVRPAACLRGFLAIPYYPFLESHRSCEIHIGHSTLESILHRSVGHYDKRHR